MKSSFKLFRIFGIDIGIHFTWIIIFVFFSWSLAQGYFPLVYPDWSTAVYWIMGIVGALMIFISVLIHEMAHSLVARRRGIPVNSITLFILGGVSNLEEEPAKPSAEFAMAIAGPLTSFVLALIFWGISFIPQDAANPGAALFAYLALINLFLGGFNLLPGFPLDGGRVLRSIIWGSTGDLVKATNIAGIIGQVIGWMLIGAGVVTIFLAGLFTGLWLAFIGWFLNSAADSSRKEIALRERLSLVKVREVIRPVPETIGPQTTVDEMVRNIFSRQHGRAVPVCDGERLIGIVTITDIKKVPQDSWAITPVERIMSRDPLYTVTPDDNLNTVMQLLIKHDINQVLVKQDEKCAGLLSRADIINHLRFIQELGLRR